MAGGCGGDGLALSLRDGRSLSAPAAPRRGHSQATALSVVLQGGSTGTLSNPRPVCAEKAPQRRPSSRQRSDGPVYEGLTARTGIGAIRGFIRGSRVHGPSCTKSQEVGDGFSRATDRRCRAGHHRA